MARPSEFTQEVADKICEGLMDGRSLRNVCLEDDMPSKTTVFRWLQVNEKFSDQYARARAVQAEIYADEINDIADDGSNDYMTITVNGHEKEVVNQENIQRSRLRVDSRKWIASKLLPKVYGDKQQVEHTGKLTLEQLLTSDVD